MLPFLPIMKVKRKSGILCGISPPLNVNNEVNIIQTLYSPILWGQIKFVCHPVPCNKPQMCYVYSSKKTKKILTSARQTNLVCINKYSSYLCEHTHTFCSMHMVLGTYCQKPCLTLFLFCLFPNMMTWI